MSPALVILVLEGLILAELLYALGPYRRRSIVIIAALVAVGIAAGQLWAIAGLPAWKLSEADLLPALAFALFLQVLHPLLGRLPIHLP